MVLLSAALAVNTKRLDDQQETMKIIVATVLSNGLKMDQDAKVAKDFAERGSIPAQETATAMKAARAMMEEVSKRRDAAIAEQTAIIKKLVDKLEAKP